MDDVSGLPEFWKEFSSLGQEVDFFVTARLFDGTPAVWPQELNYIKTHRQMDHLRRRVVGRPSQR